MNLNVSVILPAAGLGSRFTTDRGASASKIEYELDHKPVFLHAIEAFRGAAFPAGHVGQIILAVHPDRLDEFRFRWEAKLEFLGVTLIPGGTVERWETVKLALERVADDATHVAVHDAARPCVSPKLIERVLTAAERYDAVAPALPVSSTLKRAVVSESAGSSVVDDILGPPSSPAEQLHRVVETVPRDGLYAIQTPQVFEVGLLRRAYDAIDGATTVTDDAALVEKLGGAMHLVDGEPANLKLTRPADAELLEALIAHRKQAAAKSRAVADLFGDDDED